ncbi:MAG: hypothetical protein NC543_09005 [bacterium]|nr:hypothetical protein [bacterium]MCM1375765.1 hypothetical protein [Muribaculum sp.]
MEESLQGKMEEQNDQQQTKVWFPARESHRVLVISVIVSIILATTGILLIWGHIAAMVVCVLLIILAIWIHFLRQRWLQLDRGILYFDRGEFYIIFLNKKDTELDAYLHGQLKVDIEGRSPEELLLDLARLSVISRIPEIIAIRKKDNKTFLAASHRVIPYPYTSFMEIPTSERKYEHFDDLMQTALSFMDKADKIHRKAQ